MFTDSHCHINSDDFNEDREQVVFRAREMKIDYILDVSDDIARTPQIIDFCSKHKHIYTTSGVHPELAKSYQNLNAEKILELTASAYVVGIGECGLDYFYNGDSIEEQKKVFMAHIEAAQQSGLPLVVHSRDADDDMIEMLQRAYKQKPFKGELHCFSSSKKLCKAGLEIGFYISASGIITFKSGESLRKIFANVPNDRLLIETDSPFLAPVPHRGKRNEPAYVVNTAQVLADLKGLEISELADITTNNFLKLFNRVKANG
ncbi:MAG: TatD family hydrolase [Alphaproteobacteria bacterium]|nr:TatD family hydrolase [Alphaproteobacteria bacterium]